MDAEKSPRVQPDHDGLKNSPDALPKEMVDGKGEEQTSVSDVSEHERQYPSMWKLIPIMAALCCSVFCTGLV
jgi:hypothetical protein